MPKPAMTHDGHYVSLGEVSWSTGKRRPRTKTRYTFSNLGDLSVLSMNFAMLVESQ